MSEKLSDNVSIDDDADCITIYGVRFNGRVFKQVGDAMPNVTGFELAKSHDVYGDFLVLRNLSGTEELP